MHASYHGDAVVILIYLCLIAMKDVVTYVCFQSLTLNFNFHMDTNYSYDHLFKHYPLLRSICIRCLCLFSAVMTDSMNGLTLERHSKFNTRANKTYQKNDSFIKCVLYSHPFNWFFCGFFSSTGLKFVDRMLFKNFNASLILFCCIFSSLMSLIC